MAIFCRFSKYSHFSNISCSFEAVFCFKTTVTWCINVFSMFLCIFNLWPNSEDFGKSIASSCPFFFSKCSHYFQYKLFFGTVFCIEQLQWVVETFLACFYAFLIFDPKWRFCKVYSLCLVAIFGNFQNALIFRILAVFWSRFLHRTTAMCCRNVFSMFLCISNFWPKVTILESL